MNQHEWRSLMMGRFASPMRSDTELPPKVTAAIRDATENGCRVVETESFVRVTGPRGPHEFTLTLAGFKRAASGGLGSRRYERPGSDMEPTELTAVWEWQSEEPIDMLTRAIGLLARYEEKTGLEPRELRVHPADWYLIARGPQWIRGGVVRLGDGARRIGTATVVVDSSVGRMTVW